jgi:hypothetical protein
MVWVAEDGAQLPQRLARSMSSPDAATVAAAAATGSASPVVSRLRRVMSAPVLLSEAIQAA